MTLLLRPTQGVAGIPVETLPSADLGIVARIAWRPDQFQRCANPGFEVDTTGWAVTTGVNAAAGTSIVRDTTDPQAGTGCGRLVTAATTGSGVHYDFGTTRFGWLPFTVVVWLKRISGGRRASIIIGSEGTAADRARVDVTLTDAWQPYGVTWFPSGFKTDAQLAVTTGDDVAITMDIDGVEVYADRLSQLAWLPNSTAGWTSDGSGQAAASTHSWNTSDGFGSGASHTITTTSTSGSGIDFDLAGIKFTSGRTYRLRVGLLSTSGSTSCRLRLGSTGDQTDSTVTMATTWGWHTIDWTPGSDITTALISLSNASAAANAFRLDGAEVYESLDDVTLEALEVRRGSRFDGAAEPPGTFAATVLDPDAIYSPRNMASPLTGGGAFQEGVFQEGVFQMGTGARNTPMTGRPFHVRGDYKGALHAIAYGTITELAPVPDERKVIIRGDDGLAELDYQVDRPFTSDVSYAAARAAALTWTPSNVTNGAPVLHTAEQSLATDSIEASTFYDGTDSTVSLLDYLGDLNEATGSIHFCDPQVVAVRPWKYRTISRATLTDDAAGTTIDESFQRMSDVYLREESLITRQRVSWQGYESGTTETVAAATADVPYLTYATDVYGSSDRPEPEEVYALKRRRGRKRRKRRKLKLIGTRWVEALLPVTITAGSRHTFVIDFLVPMENVSATVTGASVYTVDATPARVSIHVDAGTSDVTVTALSIDAIAHVPLDEADAVWTAWDAGTVREDQPIDNEFVPSAGMAEGLAEYRTWRYSESRLRPEVTDQHFVPRQLILDVGSHITLSADRWHIAGARYVIRAIEHTITEGGKDFESTYQLEELPSGGTWFTLDGGGSRGLGSSATLAH